jgi:hypothetical protein
MVSATFTSGPRKNATESLTFNAQKCGEATVTVNGNATPTTLSGPI